MDAALMLTLLRQTAGVQTRHDTTPPEPLKRAAKRVCTDLLRQHLSVGDRILDVGGEEFYHAELADFVVTVANLPDQDMHELVTRAGYEAVVAMHVLEHSPFPLYVLALLQRALVPGGWCYVAVPEPSPVFLQPRFGHWSLLPRDGWRCLIETAGFTIAWQQTGQMGARKEWVEHRFLCRKAA